HLPVAQGPAGRLYVQRGHWDQAAARDRAATGARRSRRSRAANPRLSLCGGEGSRAIGGDGPDRSGRLCGRTGERRTSGALAEAIVRRRHRLLRARRERPRGRPPAEQRDEFAASHHSITSAAMASSPGGKLRPNALAVLRLITSSNLVDCMTGRSAGFSPLRIRPVYTPAWRYASVMLVP